MQIERQSSSVVAFLQSQNRRVREQVREFKELLQLNRSALKIALAPREGEQQLPVLVRLLFEQNEKLLRRCARLQQQVDTNSCQALISSQIASASNEHEKYVAEELKNRLRLLKRELEAKDRRIGELSKLGSRQREQQVVQSGRVQLVQFTDCSKVSQKLFREGQSLRKELQMREQEVVRLREQKDELIRLNLILTRQVSELKQYSQQSTGSQKREMNSSSDMSRYMKYQAKIAEQEGELSEGASQEDSESSSGSYRSEAVADKELRVQKVSKVVLPKLQMRRAKDIQTLIVSKINNEEKRKAGQKEEKVKKADLQKLQTQCEELQRKWGDEVSMRLRVERENEFLKKFVSELEQRNELLLRRQEASAGWEYGRSREGEGTETLLDICRDVTMNERLRNVCRGREQIAVKLSIHSKQV